ncbi:MAG: hypothetical protein JNN13_15070 [Planctomycetes bacterium]|nr:hypothetical protein [Planctomycetota bacterium]
MMMIPRLVVLMIVVLVSADAALAQRGFGPGGDRGPRGGRGWQARAAGASAQRAVVAQGVALSAALVTQLQGTLADEYLARDFYRAAADRFDRRDYLNHVRAEENHIAALRRVLLAAGVEPVAAAGRTTEVPESVVATGQQIATLERDMIRAYDRLLDLAAGTDLVPMLQNIQQANRRHLAAVDGGDGEGPRGRRQGGGRRAGRGVDSRSQCEPACRSCRR